MRNLKRFLAVVVTIAMLAMFSISAFAAVPSDVKGTEYEAAATRLIALGILTGYPDGTFGPNDTITRAQFAAVVVRALGLEDSAKAAAGQTKFADVAATYWAAGYINMASSLKIINGYPNGKFGPEDKVTYEQAVAMAMRALGYSPKADTLGGYPSGYLVVANDEDVTKGVNGVAGSPAPRGLVAKLVDNALETPLMIQVGYGTDVKYVKSGEEGTKEQTLLDNKLKLDVLEARVVSTGDKLEVKYTANTDNPSDKRGVKEKLNVFETVSQVGLEDSLVTLWVKDGVVYNIKNKSTVYYDTISKINGEDKTANITTVQDINDITLKIADINLDLATNTSDDVTPSTAEVKVDRVLVSNYAAANSADALLTTFAKVVVEDGKVVKIQAYGMSKGGIITATAADYVTYTQGGSEDRKVRGLEDPDSLLVVIDNKAASYADLKADMYFDFKKLTNDYVIAATTTQITGKLTRAQDTKVAIDGTYTDLATPSYFSTDAGDKYDLVNAGADTFVDLLTNDVVAYVDNEGKIAYVKGDAKGATDTFYGFVVAAPDSFDDRIKVVKNVDGEEKTVTYNTDLDSTSPVKLTGPLAVKVSSADATAILGDGTDDKRVDAFYKFTFDADGVITKIEDAYVLGTNVTANNVSFNKNSNSIVGGSTRVFVNDDTLIYDISDKSDITVLHWADIKDADIAGVNLYANKIDGPDYVLLADTDATVSFSGKQGFLGFVTSKQRVDTDNYEYEMTLPADTATFTVDKGKLASSGKFDVVAYKLTSTDGKVEIVDKAAYDQLGNLGDGTNDLVPGITTDTEDQWNGLAPTTVTGVDSKYITLNGTGKVRVASDAIILKINGARDEYTEADLGDIDVGNNASALLVNGEVKVLFFWE